MTAPLRVLHVVSRMDPGGVETWLMHVLRRADPNRVRFLFYAQSGRPGAYDDEIRARGSRIIVPSRRPSSPFFSIALLHDLKKHGPFDVVHSHVHFFGGAVLAVARAAGIHSRIAHSHLDTRELERRASLSRRLYMFTLRRFIARYATLKLATSDAAARALFGDDYRRDPSARLHFCSLDFSPFERPVDRDSIRHSLGIPAHSFVVGHVGRFEAQKNHEFLLRTFCEVLRRSPDARLVLVGDGPTRPMISAQASELGIASSIIFTGLRRDVPELMLGAFDVFAFPSHYEGLGLVVLEAQAAGLPCVIADTVPREADVRPSHIIRMPVSASPSRWADAIVAHGSSRLDASEAIAALRQSPFAIDRGVDELLSLYERPLRNERDAYHPIAGGDHST